MRSAAPGAHCSSLLLLLALAPLSLLLFPTAAQTGFTSLNCGGPAGSGFVDPVTTIAWQADGNFTTTGESSPVDLARAPNGLATELRTLRYFPPGSSPNKNCYQLPVVLNSVNLIRLGFYYGNYDLRRAATIRFKIAVDATLWQDLTIDGTSPAVVYFEAITAPAIATNVSVCLIRTQLDAPFVNSLELRPLLGSVYTATFLPRRVNLHLLSRINFGERVSPRRFPEDSHDRIWPPYLQVVPSLNGLVRDISAPPGQRVESSGEEPPSIVMQTAITAPSISYTRDINLEPGSLIFMSQMFAELNASADIRVIEYSSTFQAPTNVSLTPLDTRPFQTYQWGNRNVSIVDGTTSISVTLARNGLTILDPLVNADELYTVVDVRPGTDPVQVQALMELKTLWQLDTWVGDPCEPVPWDELTCDNTTSTVTSLDLGGDKLGGILSLSLGSLTSLVNLNLKDNSFSGALPSSLGSLTALEVLDISDNLFSGPLPAWLETLPALKQLDLSNNYFTGTVPPSLIQRLGPNFKYFGNTQLQCTGPLCVPGGPVPPAGPPAVGLQQGSSNNAENMMARKGSGLVVPVIVGVAASLFVILILIAVGLFYWSEVRGRRTSTNQASPPHAARAADEANHAPGFKFQSEVTEFTLSGIQDATKRYSRKIGEGSFGPVYYGVIAQKQEVAVKILSGQSHQTYREFFNEVDLLAQLHHKNLVSMVGYCEQSTHLILIYEYMAGGDLKTRLYGRDAAVNPLSWRCRLDIAKGAAEGIEHLHRSRIIHRDVRSSNILLTHKLEPKVADFGLSRKTPGQVDHKTTIVKGTTGYLDPEYYRTSTLTEKSDVYSFGVVLMEILCGRPPIALEDTDMAPHERGIIEFVKRRLKAGHLSALMDPRLDTDYSPDAAQKLADLAMRCVNMHQRGRPIMADVVRHIQLAIDLEESSMEARDKASPYNYPDTYPISHPWHLRSGSSASNISLPVD